MEKLPCYGDENNNVKQLRALTVEVINKLNVEFNRRFSELNSVLWKSYEILRPSHDHILQAEELVPLLGFIKTIPAACHKVTDLSFEQLNSECNVFRSVLKEFSIEQDKLYERARQEMMKQETVGRKVTKVKKEDKIHR